MKPILCKKKKKKRPKMAKADQDSDCWGTFCCLTKNLSSRFRKWKKLPQLTNSLSPQHLWQSWAGGREEGPTQANSVWPPHAGIGDWVCLLPSPEGRRERGGRNGLARGQRWEVLQWKGHFYPQIIRHPLITKCQRY